MNIFRMSSKFIQNTTPVGLLVGGTVLALSLPVLRKGLKCAAVLTVRGIYTVVEEAKKIKNQSANPEEANS